MTATTGSPNYFTDPGRVRPQFVLGLGRERELRALVVWGFGENGNAASEFTVEFSTDGGANYGGTEAVRTGALLRFGSARLDFSRSRRADFVRVTVTKNAAGSGHGGSGGDRVAMSELRLVAAASAPARPAVPLLAEGDGKLLVSWAAPGDGGAAITSYDVRHRGDGDVNWGAPASVQTQEPLGFTITGLDNGSLYLVQVRAVNANGAGEWSEPARAAPAPVPDRPAAPSLAEGDGKLLVSWAAPANGGSAITFYEVRHRGDGDANWTTARLSRRQVRRGLSYEIGSLGNGSPYLVQVRAVNANGAGAWSLPAQATPRTVPGKPDAPLLAEGDEQIRLSWAAPANGGSTITFYDVRHRRDGSRRWTVTDLAWIVAGPLEFTIDGLTNDTVYEVQVRAVNYAGRGEWSESARATPSAELLVVPVSITLEAGDTSSGGYGVSNLIDGSGLSEPATIDNFDTVTTSTSAAGDLWVTPRLGDGNYFSDPNRPRPRFVLGLGRERELRSLVVWGFGGSGNEASEFVVEFSTDGGATYGGAETVATAALLGSGSARLDFSRSRRADFVRVTVTDNAAGSGHGGAGGDRVAMSELRAVAAVSVPGRPAAPSLAAGNAKLLVSWAAPGDGGLEIVSYDVRHSGDGGVNWTTAVSAWTQGALEHTVSSLDNGTVYAVQVRAVNAAGAGEWSASASAAPAPVPDRPDAPSLVEGDGKLLVSWTAPANGGAAIASYDVRHSRDGGESWTTAVSAWTQGVLEHTVSSLDNGVAHLVQVRAVNANGAGAWSASAQATPMAVPDRPDAPSLVEGDGKLLVSWTAPANGGAAIASYDVRHSRDDGVNWAAPVEAWAVGSGPLAYTIAGLDNGSPYLVQVRAVNANGAGAWSASAQAAPSAELLVAPASIALVAGDTLGGVDVGNLIDGSGLSEAATMDSFAFVTTTVSGATAWVTATSAPSGNYFSDAGRPRPRFVLGLGRERELRALVVWGYGGNGSEASEFTVEFSTDGGATYGGAETVETAALLGSGSARLDFSRSRRADFVRVTVTDNAAGSGHGGAGGDRVGMSELRLVAAVTAPGRPAAPSLAAGNAKLLVSWAAPGDGGLEISSYDVRHSGDGGVNWTTAASAWTQGALEHTVSSLDNGTAYAVQVRAVNAAGAGPWSVSASAAPAPVPDRPAAPSLAAGDAKLEVSWAAPANGGSAITSYDVRHSRDGGESWTAAVSAWTQGVLEYTVSSLDNGVSYLVQVRAVNANGAGAWSASAQATLIAVPGRPAAPSLAAGNAKLLVSWAAPADGGSAITSYDVRHSRDGGANWTTARLSPLQVFLLVLLGLPYEIASLDNGTVYAVQVRAVNANGAGAWSASASAAPAPVPDRPAAPSLTEGDGKLLVSWAAPANGGSAITSYEVRHSRDGGESWTVPVEAWTTGSGQLVYTIAGLDNAVSYLVQVRAVNANGAGAWSASAQAAPSAELLVAPASIALVAGDTSGGFDVGNLIDGSGLSESATMDNFASVTTTVSAATAWVTATSAPSGNYFSDAGRPRPRFVLGLGRQRELRALVVWGYGGNSSEASEFTVEFSTDGGNSYSTDTEAVETAALLGSGSARLDFSRSRRADFVRVTVTDNAAGSGHGGAGGDRVGMSELRLVAAVTAPGRPAAPSLAAGNAKLLVSWAAPGDGGLEISSYDVRHSRDSGVNWTTAASAWTQGALEHTVSSLDNGTAYAVQVRAR